MTILLTKQCRIEMKLSAVYVVKKCVSLNVMPLRGTKHPSAAPEPHLKAPAL